MKFDFLKVPFWTPEKVCFGFWRKPPKQFFFFVFRLWFSFINNRRTNDLLVGIFENAQKKVIDHQKHHFDHIWRLMTIFLCVFKKTDQNNNCVSIILKAETEKKIKKNIGWPPKRAFLSFEIKTIKQIFLHIFVVVLFSKTIDTQMLFWFKKILCLIHHGVKSFEKSWILIRIRVSRLGLICFPGIYTIQYLVLPTIINIVFPVHCRTISSNETH